jgi:hypothetical protein
MTPDTSMSLRSAQRQSSPQQLVTRHNAVMFYGVAAASLLEAAAAQRAAQTSAAFSADAGFHAWIERAWSPAKSAHAAAIRAYIASMWPDFDWYAASEAFAEDYLRQVRPSRAGCSLASDALTQGAGAAQAAAFYRGLGCAADDRALRELLLAMAADEAAHFDRFRGCYERHRRRERFGALAGYRVIVACATRARNVDVQVAFSRLGAEYWFRSAPFHGLPYAEFVARIRDVVRRHVALGPAQRLLFKPWLNACDLPAGPAAAITSPPDGKRGWGLPRLAGGVVSR